MWVHLTLPWRRDSLQKTTQVFSRKDQVVGSHQACIQNPQAHEKPNASHDPPSHEVPPYDQECNHPCEYG